MTTADEMGRDDEPLFTDEQIELMIERIVDGPFPRLAEGVRDE